VRLATIAAIKNSALKESKREQTSAENRQTSGTGVNCPLCVLLPPRTLLLGAYMALGATWQLVTDLLSIGFVTFIFAGLLSSPGSTGLVGRVVHRVNTNLAPGTLVEPIPAEMKIIRYVISLSTASLRQDPVPTRG